MPKVGTAIGATLDMQGPFPLHERFLTIHSQKCPYGIAERPVDPAQRAAIVLRQQSRPSALGHIPVYRRQLGQQPILRRERKVCLTPLLPACALTVAVSGRNDDFA